MRSVYSYINQHSYSAVAWLTGVGLAVSAGLGIGLGGIKVAALLTGLPFFLAGAIGLFKNPRLGLFMTVVYGFFIAGLSRYIGGVPWGLGTDGLLILTLVALFIKTGTQFPVQRLKKGYMVAIAIWMLYYLAQLFNPLAPSRIAWFYAMRGIAFYQLLFVGVGLMLLRSRKDVNTFLIIWIVLSILATFTGLRQKFIGLDGAEKAWLAAGAATQHILFGKLRIFSFYSDAGQFGAAQAHMCLIALILALGNTSIRNKLIYAGVSVLSLYGMLISGTRGALAVLVIGIPMYLFLSKNYKLLIIGLLVYSGSFAFLKYTTIGNEVYEIRRVRTALDPNEASLQVRLNNQKILAAYMNNKPFGAGVGSVGSWGQRFAPGSFLAEMPTDSWYVNIWVEGGKVGLILYLILMGYMVIHGAWIVSRIRDPNLKQQCAALLAGFVGILAASYGNAVLGQFPTGPVIYMSMAVLAKAPEWDTPRRSEISSS